MNISFKVLRSQNLDAWIEIRNQNSKWFKDTKPVEFEKTVHWLIDSRAKGDLNFLIAGLFLGHNEVEELYIGTISIYDISPTNTFASLGRMAILDAYKNQGFMTEALKKVFDFSKNFLGLRELHLEVRYENIIARDFYTKLGFETFAFSNTTIGMRKSL